jgi:hypothetical protein
MRAALLRKSTLKALQQSAPTSENYAAKFQVSIKRRPRNITGIIGKGDNDGTIRVGLAFLVLIGVPTLIGTLSY